MSSGCINIFVQGNISDVDLYFPEMPKLVCRVIQNPACHQGPSFYPSCLIRPQTPHFSPQREEGTSILGAKRTQGAEHQPILKTVKQSDEDCPLRVSDQMPETSDLEDSRDNSLGAGYAQGTPSYSSSHHLYSGVAAPFQSNPMTRLALSGEPSSCSSSS